MPPLEYSAPMDYIIPLVSGLRAQNFISFLMEFLTAIAVAALVWLVTVATLLYCLFKGHIPSEESNMVVYFILQAAVPTAVFWWMTHR